VSITAGVPTMIPAFEANEEDGLALLVDRHRKDK
jgi:hypothetical protein